MSGIVGCKTERLIGGILGFTLRRICLTWSEFAFLSSVVIWNNVKIISDIDRCENHDGVTKHVIDLSEVCLLVLHLLCIIEGI